MTTMLNDVTPEFLAELAQNLPDGALFEVDRSYLEEPRGRYFGRAAAVAKPRNAQEISAILRLASAARVGVIPYGGGTGLVAGQVMTSGPAPLLLSLERMKRVRGVYPAENVIVVEAGATVADVQSASADANRLFPLSYGSEGTAQIGAGLSVNSGGIGVLRYGNARELCLGVEAVLPDGSILNGLQRLRKNNTGYDIRNLLIGSEGTLGVLTAAALRLFPKPARSAAALMSVGSPDAALELLELAQMRVGEGVSGFELLSGVGLGFVEETGLRPRWPLSQHPEWAVLIDLGLSGALDPATELEAIFADALARGLVSDGVMSQSESQHQDFWSLREAIPMANARIGAIASHDISLPLSEISSFLRQMTPRIEARGGLRVNAFGHLGDGNLHYNVFPMPGRIREDFENIRAEISHDVHREVVARGGSFSAEHGVGRLKVGDLEEFGDPTKLAAMRAIKAALDPAGIMNPGAVLGPSQK